MRKTAPIRLLLAALLLAGLNGVSSAQWPPAQNAPQEGWASSPQPAQPQSGWGTVPPQAVDTDPGSRINRLEEQLRAMNGKVEQLEFQNRTLQDQLKKVQDDAEFRFQELEGKKPGTRPQQRSAAPANHTAVTMDNAPAGEDEVISPTPKLGAPPRALGQLATDAAGNPVNLAPPGAVSQPLEPLPSVTQDEDRAEETAPLSQQAAVSSVTDDPKNQYDLAYGYMLRGDYEMAEVSFKDFLQDHPKDTNAGNAAYWLGESQYQRKQYKAAAESFLKVYNEHPSAPKAPESLLRLGMSLKALGQKDASCATLAEVVRKYPKSSTAVKKRVQTEQKNAGC